MIRKTIIKLTFSLLFLNAFLVSYSQDRQPLRCKDMHSSMKRYTPTEEELAYANELRMRSDTFDILNYNIHLTELNYNQKSLTAWTEIDLKAKIENQNSIRFDLLGFEVDSAFVDNAPVAIQYDGRMITLHTENVISVSDTTTFRIHYHGVPIIDPSDFGGFYFRDKYMFNLGIGLASIPHNYGRGWFPCFDNFVERSTYNFFVTTALNKEAHCSGSLISIDTTDNSKIFHYQLNHPIPTYLAGVAVADFDVVHQSYHGIDRSIPIKLVSKPEDTSRMAASLAFIPEAMETFEEWYGPYVWDQIGYVLTAIGAMEHATLIAYPESVGSNGNPLQNMYLMAHELAHHWWGDYTTLTTAGDMWIKEGNASYAYYLMVKDYLGEEEFIEEIRDNQHFVVTEVHRHDDGFLALSGMPEESTYGETTYEKGAAMMHNMHSYMGDSLYKVGLQYILSKYPFGHLDAEQYLQALNEGTGLDMSSFFNDWIYRPGFSAFEIDSIHRDESNGEVALTIYYEQKTYHAPEYHTKVPMQLTCVDSNWKKHNVIAQMSGQSGEVEIVLDFDPMLVYLNENSFLSNGQLLKSFMITEPGKLDGEELDVTKLKVESVTDSALVYVEHIFGAPDDIFSEDSGILELAHHYYKVDGVKSGELHMSTNFIYEGRLEYDLDKHLIIEDEEDIELLYRKDASQPWSVYPHYTKNIFIPIDKTGHFAVDSLAFGQYTFGTLDPTHIVEYKQEIPTITAYPNPVSEAMHLDLVEFHEVGSIEIFDEQGRMIILQEVDSSTVTVDISSYQAGPYYFLIRSNDSEMLAVGKVIKL